MTRRDVDATHDPALESWVESAHDAASDFPIQNLPLGVFTRGDGDRARIGVAIGERILDLDACVNAGLLETLDARVRASLGAPSLNALAELGPSASHALRGSLSALLRADTTQGASARAAAPQVLFDAAACTMHVPFAVGDYTDFYASLDHATNVGAMFRPDNPLLPNYKWVPIGYHGRASSIVPSGSAVTRPRGQTRPDAAQPPVFGATTALDYELEVGAWVGQGTTLGNPVAIARAESHVLGLGLVNDWSARDIQSWEYQPLGPFLAKNFATTVSPWVVTLEALAPFRVAPSPRAAGDPAPLPYLSDAGDRAAGAFGITLEVWLRTERMRAAGAPAARVSRGDFRTMYWTVAQMITHHASNGCNLRAGDLVASGTVSGPAVDARGCLLELTRRGAEPIALPNGETRGFLADGDEVVLRGWCERDGYRRIGFGECTGVVAPPGPQP